MKAITGNELKSGRVVYLSAAGVWTEHLKDAAVFADDAADVALEAAQARVLDIADVYLIDVAEDAAPAGRAALKETIRAAGPTVREDLGKQAGNA